MITEFNGKKVENINDYTAAIEGVKIGQPVKVEGFLDWACRRLLLRWIARLLVIISISKRVVIFRLSPMAE